MEFVQHPFVLALALEDEFKRGVFMLNSNHVEYVEEVESRSSPFSSTARTLAPLASSSWTTTVRPFFAATCRGL